MSNLGYGDLKSEGWNQSFYKYIPELLLANTPRVALQVPTKVFLHGHAFSTLQVSSPTSPIISANTEPTSQWHCQKWQHKAEILMMSYEVMGQERVTYFNIIFVARKLYCRFETDMSSFHQFICLSWMTSLHSNRPVAAESHENWFKPSRLSCSLCSHVNVIRAGENSQSRGGWKLLISGTRKVVISVPCSHEAAVPVHTERWNQFTKTANLDLSILPGEL